MHDRGGQAADAHPIDGNDLVLLAESDGEELLTVPRGDLFAQERVDVGAATKHNSSLWVRLLDEGNARRPDRKACNVRQSAVYTPEP